MTPSINHDPACPIRIVDDGDEGRIIYFFTGPLPEGGFARRTSLHVAPDGEVTLLMSAQDSGMESADVTNRKLPGLLREMADFLEGNCLQCNPPSVNLARIT